MKTTAISTLININVTLTVENEPALHRSFEQHRLSQVSSSPHSCRKKSLSFLQVASVRHPFLYTMSFWSSITSSDVNLAHLSSPLLQVTALLFWMQCSIDMALWHSKHLKFVTVNKFLKVHLLIIVTVRIPFPVPPNVGRKTRSSNKHPLQQIISSHI